MFSIDGLSTVAPTRFGRGDREGRSPAMALGNTITVQRGSTGRGVTRGVTAVSRGVWSAPLDQDRENGDSSPSWGRTG
jgi:hypothetical protein